MKWISTAIALSVVLTGLSLGGCQAARNCSACASSGVSDAKVLEKLDASWSDAAQSRDATKVGAFYASDAIVYPPGEPAAIGRDAATKVWARYFAEPSFNIRWTTTHAEASGDLGYTAGTYLVTVSGPDGKPAKDVGKFMCVWKKQPGGGWMAHRDFWNSDSN